MKRILLVIICFMCIAAGARAGYGYEPLRTVLHVHSKFSHKGKLTLEEITRLAEKKGIDVVITADDALKQWEWGAFPWPGVFKKRISLPSVYNIGIENYLRESGRVNVLSKDCLVIPGLEVTPHYYWVGMPFQERFEIHNSQKHMIVFGLEDQADWEGIPFMHNKGAYRYNLKSILLLWPIIIMIIAIKQLFSRRKRFRAAAVVVFLLSALFAADYFPFSVFPYDQYKMNVGEKPYQNLIDYIVEKGGLVFWAHPEATNYENKKIYKNLTMKTPLYQDSMLATHDYTGFCYYYEGRKFAGKPGGVWDRVLNEYRTGQREKPVWSVNELDFTDPGENGKFLGLVDNIVLAESKTSDSVLEAMRAGRYYMRLNRSTDIRLENVFLKAGMKRAGMGGTVDSGPGKGIKFSAEIRDLRNKSKWIDLDLIRNGEVIYSKRYSLPARFIFPAKGPESGMDYYRLELRAQGRAHVVTNPIFVVSR